MTPEIQWLRRAEFLQGCSHLSQFPPAGESVEVAFAGRSNAGKSSILNRLCDNRRLARVGKTPGRTREINLFTLPRHALPADAAAPTPAAPEDDRRSTLLADLPGYGYAKVARSLALGELLTSYLTSSRHLCGLVLVSDMRRGLTDGDRILLKLCAQRGLASLLLLNKSDKVSQSDRSKALALMRKQSPARTLLCSARTGVGIDDLATWVVTQMRDRLSAV